MGGIPRQDHEVGEAQALRREGKTYKQIARRMKRSQAFVMKLLRETPGEIHKTETPQTENMDTKTFATFIVDAPITRELKVKILSEIIAWAE